MYECKNCGHKFTEGSPEFPFSVNCPLCSSYNCPQEEETKKMELVYVKLADGTMVARFECPDCGGLKHSTYCSCQEEAHNKETCR